MSHALAVLASCQAELLKFCELRSLNEAAPHVATQRRRSRQWRLYGSHPDQGFRELQPLWPTDRYTSGSDAFSAGAASIWRRRDTY